MNSQMEKTDFFLHRDEFNQLAVTTVIFDIQCIWKYVYEIAAIKLVPGGPCTNHYWHFELPPKHQMPDNSRVHVSA